MENLVSLIDHIFEEHKTILHNAERLEKISNDTEALKVIESGKQSFMPGRENTQQGLKELALLRDNLETGLLAHFDREETILLEGFRNYKDSEVTDSLETILNEHTVIRERLMELKGLVAELMAQPLSRHIWEAKGYDMRAHISNLFNLIKIHATAEQHLLLSVRKKLAEK